MKVTRLKSGGFMSSGTDAFFLFFLKKGGKTDMMGASPSEIKEMTRKKRSDALKKVNRSPKRMSINPGTKIKGEKERDLARLEKKKKESAEFEKTLKKKKLSQTSKFGLFDTGAPRLGVMTGRRGKSLFSFFLI